MGGVRGVRFARFEGADQGGEAKTRIANDGHIRRVVAPDDRGVGVEVDELARDLHGPVARRTALEPRAHGEDDICFGEHGVHRRLGRQRAK